jgi:hypothetical protein
LTERSHAAQTPIRERADADALPGAEPIDEGDERFDARVGIWVDVHADPRPAHQQLLEARDPHAAVAVRKLLPPSGENLQPASAASISVIATFAISPRRFVEPSKRES